MTFLPLSVQIALLIRRTCKILGKLSLKGIIVNSYKVIYLYIGKWYIDSCNIPFCCSFAAVFCFFFLVVKETSFNFIIYCFEDRVFGELAPKYISDYCICLIFVCFIFFLLCVLKLLYFHFIFEDFFLIHSLA